MVRASSSTQLTDYRGGITTAYQWYSATTTYEYDALGALRAVRLPNGNVLEYVVDGRGHRVGKRVNGVLLQQWVYGGGLGPVAELDGNGAVKMRFVYGSRANVYRGFGTRVHVLNCRRGPCARRLDRPLHCGIPRERSSRSGIGRGYLLVDYARRVPEPGGYIGHIGGGFIAGAALPFAAAGLEIGGAAGLIMGIAGTAGGGGAVGSALSQATEGTGDVDIARAAGHGALNLVGSAARGAVLTTSSGGAVLTAEGEAAILGNVADKVTKYFYNGVYDGIR